MEAPSEIPVTDAELGLGFSEQTLSYPSSGFDLRGLVSAGPATIERTVALSLDETNRIRRRRNGSGYLHERLTDGAWTAVAVFESLEEVAACESCAAYRLRVRGNVEDRMEEQGAEAE